MTGVVGIELCAAKFKTDKACRDWLKENGWADLNDRVKGFKLRKNASNKFLTVQEKKRAVFQWTRGYGTFKSMHVNRPSPDVVIITAAGDAFTPAELPAPLPQTIAHEQAKAARHAERVAKIREEKMARDAAQPPKEKRKRKGRTTTEESTASKKRLTNLEDQYGINLKKATTNPNGSAE